jgi:hypothetical protein
MTWSAALLMCASVGCKQGSSPPTSTGAAGTTATTPKLLPIGMTDPFAAPKGDAGKLLETAYAALRNKKPQVAVAALQNVVNDTPDYTAARWALIRGLGILGRNDEIPAQFEQLIARDYVAYATKLDTSKELAGLRASPAWAKIDELKTRYRSEYAKGLERGFFFVARVHAATEPQFDGDAVEAPLSLKQEVFHYDPDGKRYRRLTDSDGRTFAIDRSSDGKSLLFLVAPRLHREGGIDSFVDPRCGVIDLTTLETVGPFAQKGRFDQVGLGANKAGQPMFTFVVTSGASAAYTIDTARTGLAKLEGAAVIPEGGETRAWPNQVAHFEDKAVPGVKIEDGATQFLVEGVDQPVMAARPIAQSSLAWSPAKSRLTYAGKLDACKILRGDSKDKADKNELYVYDKTRHSAQRVAAAVSPFETLWLDDDRLVYEGGVGKNGQIHLYTFTTHADTSLATHHGAGLYGVPTLACEQAESGIDEDIGDEESQGD